MVLIKKMGLLKKVFSTLFLLYHSVSYFSRSSRMFLTVDRWFIRFFICETVSFYRKIGINLQLVGLLGRTNVWRTGKTSCLQKLFTVFYAFTKKTYIVKTCGSILLWLNDNEMYICYANSTCLHLQNMPWWQITI